MLYALLLSSAWADVIILDTGATLSGDLARYELGGDCQISVTEGDLTGVIVITPCHRVQSFVRTQLRVPEAIGLADALEAPAAEAPAAVEAPIEAEAVEDYLDEPVEAPIVPPSSPQSMIRPTPPLETHGLRMPMLYAPERDTPVEVAPADQDEPQEEREERPMPRSITF